MAEHRDTEWGDEEAEPEAADDERRRTPHLRQRLLPWEESGEADRTEEHPHGRGQTWPHPPRHPPAGERTYRHGNSKAQERHAAVDGPLDQHEVHEERHADQHRDEARADEHAHHRRAPHGLRREHGEPGTRLRIDRPDTDMIAEVTKLPFLQ